MKHGIRWMAALVAIFTALQLVGCAQAPVANKKVAPSKLEPIEGSNFKRVILTEKAAERLDIQTVAVRAEAVTRERRVGGQVLDYPTEPSAETTPAADTALDAQAEDLSRLLVRINLSQSELNQVDRSQPVRVLPLEAGDDGEDSDEAGFEGVLDDDLAGIDDAEETEGPGGSASLYYAVDNPGSGKGLEPGQPVFVRFILTGSGTERKIVPFAALLYGVHGETWVYTNPEPLVFVREPVTVDYIEEDEAFLSEGPAVGTEVVTVGGSLLYGAETGVSK